MVVESQAVYKHKTSSRCANRPFLEYVLRKDTLGSLRTSIIEHVAEQSQNGYCRIEVIHLKMVPSSSSSQRVEPSSDPLHSCRPIDTCSEGSLSKSKEEGSDTGARVTDVPAPPVPVGARNPQNPKKSTAAEDGDPWVLLNSR